MGINRLSKAGVLAIYRTQGRIVKYLDSIIPYAARSSMSKIKQIAAWVAIIGGGIGFFFFSQYMAEVMR